MSYNKNLVRTFFIFILISLLGNSCAEFALIWYAISKGGQEFHKDSLSFIFIGQGVGISILAPIFSVYFDRLPKKIASIAIDAAYALILVLCLVLYYFDSLTPILILIVSLFTSALSATHKSGVSFSALQEISNKETITKHVSSFLIISTASTMIGFALSGWVYRHLSLSGCLVIGIVTFIPIMFMYGKIFTTDKVDAFIKKKISARSLNFKNSLKESLISFSQEIQEAFQVLKADKVLLHLGISIGTVNIASGVMTGIVGISFHNFYPDRSDYYSYAISFGMLLSILAIRPFGKIARTMKANEFIFVSVFPAIIALGACFFVPHPAVVTAMYAIWLVGSTIRFVTSGSLRVSRIPKHLMGRVNTIYASMVNIGQVFGGALIIPVAQANLKFGILLMLIVLSLSSVISYKYLPQSRIKDVV